MSPGTSRSSGARNRFRDSVYKHAAPRGAKTSARSDQSGMGHVISVGRGSPMHIACRRGMRSVPTRGSVGSTMRITNRCGDEVSMKRIERTFIVSEGRLEDGP